MNIKFRCVFDITLILAIIVLVIASSKANAGVGTEYCNKLNSNTTVCNSFNGNKAESTYYDTYGDTTHKNHYRNDK